MVIAQIATTSGRSDTLKAAISSLVNQVDLIRVICNGTEPVKQHHGAVYITPDGSATRSDGWKFYGLTEFKADDIILICDDDIYYPSIFTRVMIAALETGPGVYTVMGKIMQPRPVKSFYRGEFICFRTFEKNWLYERVEIPGTCGMAFYAGTCPGLDHTFFKSMNSDIWMGIYCRQNNIPCYVIPHSAEWLTNLMPALPPDTYNVFDTYKDNDSHMVELINKYF